MYDRMVHEHGYSIRKLADKLGKDKGYLENRLRLADAPPEIRELVSLRKDSLSHAYELMKVEDPKKRRRLAEQVARGELTLIKLRDKIEGRRPRATRRRRGHVEALDDGRRRAGRRRRRERSRSDVGRRELPRRATISDDSLVNAKQSLADAVDELVGVLGSAEVRGSIGPTDRANLAKYLTIAKLRLENAIALVRSDDGGLLSPIGRRSPSPRERHAREPGRREQRRRRPPRAPRPARVGPASPRRPTRCRPR